jgi:hypothetical protein
MPVAPRETYAAGIAPQDEFEGMTAAQLVACHNASMECYRRAMIDRQAATHSYFSRTL